VVDSNSWLLFIRVCVPNFGTVGLPQATRCRAFEMPEFQIPALCLFDRRDIFSVLCVARP